MLAEREEIRILGARGNIARTSFTLRVKEQASHKPFKAHDDDDDDDYDTNVRIFLCPVPVIGKAIPLQAWTGPEGSRRLRLPYFKTVDT